MLALKLANSLVASVVLSAATQIANSFKARVIADGGNFEAKACLDAQLVILNNIQ